MKEKFKRRCDHNYRYTGRTPVSIGNHTWREKKCTKCGYKIQVRDKPGKIIPIVEED